MNAENPAEGWKKYIGVPRTSASAFLALSSTGARSSFKKHRWSSIPMRLHPKQLRQPL